MSNKTTHSYGRDYEPEIYNQAYFEGGSISGYDDYANCEEIVRRQFDMINNVMRKRIDGEGITSLDVACAYGFGVDQLRLHGWHSAGVDVSEFAVKKGIERNPEMADRLYVGDALNPETWKGNYDFDLITGVEFFEHIANVDVERVLQQMQTHGKWGFLIPNASTYPDQPHDTDGDHGHLNHNSMTWWLKKVSKYGQIDYEAMFEFSKQAYEQVPECHWHNRAIVVKFD